MVYLDPGSTPGISTNLIMNIFIIFLIVLLSVITTLLLKRLSDVLLNFIDSKNTKIIILINTFVVSLSSLLTLIYYYAFLPTLGSEILYDFASFLIIGNAIIFGAIYSFQSTIISIVIYLFLFNFNFEDNVFFYSYLVSVFLVVFTTNIFKQNIEEFKFASVFYILLISAMIMTAFIVTKFGIVNDFDQKELNIFFEYLFYYLINVVVTTLIYIFLFKLITNFYKNKSTLLSINKFDSYTPYNFAIGIEFIKKYIANNKGFFQVYIFSFDKKLENNIYKFKSYIEDNFSNIYIFKYSENQYCIFSGNSVNDINLFKKNNFNKKIESYARKNIQDFNYLKISYAIYGKSSNNILHLLKLLSFENKNLKIKNGSFLFNEISYEKFIKESKIYNSLKILKDKYKFQDRISTEILEFSIRKKTLLIPKYILEDRSHFINKISNKHLNNLEISYIKRNLNRKFVVDSLKNLKEDNFIALIYSKMELKNQDWENYLDTLQNMNALSKTLIAIDFNDFEKEDINILIKFNIPFLIHNTKANKLNKKLLNNAFLVLDKKIL